MKINIVTLISFLQDYPRWVHWLIAAWFLLTAVGLIVLMMARATKLPTTAEPANQSAQSQQTAEVSNSPGASIYQAGRDVVVKPVAPANERAWIVLKHVTSPDDVHVGIPLKVSLTFQNVGGTPATNVQAATIVEWLPPATLPSFSYKNVQLTSSATVGPQVEFRSNLYPTKDANGNIGYLVQKDLAPSFQNRLSSLHMAMLPMKILPAVRTGPISAIGYLFVPPVSMTGTRVQNITELTSEETRGHLHNSMF